MEKGWYATGLLEPLWGRVGGRDKLAEITGITPETLSGYNTGKRRLGMGNARRIAGALDVTVEQLGWQETLPQGLEERLERVEAALAKTSGHLESLEKTLDDLLGVALENQTKYEAVLGAISYVFGLPRETLEALKQTVPPPTEQLPTWLNNQAG